MNISIRIIQTSMQGPATVRELADATGAARKTIRVLIDEMHDAGVVFRINVDADHRRAGPAPVLWQLQKTLHGEADVVDEQGNHIKGVNHG